MECFHNNVDLLQSEISFAQNEKFLLHDQLENYFKNLARNLLSRLYENYNTFEINL